MPIELKDYSQLIQSKEPLTYEQLEFLLELSKQPMRDMSVMQAWHYRGFLQFAFNNPDFRRPYNCYISGDVWLGDKNSLRVNITLIEKVENRFTYLLKQPPHSHLILMCGGRLENDKFVITEPAKYRLDRCQTPGEYATFDQMRYSNSELEIKKITDENLKQQLHTLLEKTTRGLRKHEIYKQTACDIVCCTTGGVLDAFYKAKHSVYLNKTYCVPPINNSHDVLSYLAEHAAT